MIHRSARLAVASAVAALATASAAVTSGLAATSDSSRAVPAGADVQLRSLSPRQLAGQRVLYGYVGLTPPAGLLSRIRAGQAAGVIFYRFNISSDAQIKGVVAELQRAAAQSRVKEPLLMVVDQEGGEVRRLPGAPVKSAKQIGESPHPAAAARAAGRGAGRNLRGVGMNLNDAPVLDVYRKPGDLMDQYQRSFSNDPRVVARLGTDFITAQQATGVAASAKHFPGLGAAGANQDTDNHPVTLHVSRSALRHVDELPYQSAIPAGVRLVGISWAIYPALDPNRPAGFSRTVIQGELRGRLNFTGVTFSDALSAGALDPYGSYGNRALLAARAGIDLIDSGHTVSEATGAVDELANALRDGRLKRAAFMASVERVLALRSTLHR